MRTVLFEAGAIRDADGKDLRPGAIAVAGGRIVALGTPERVAESIGRAALERVDLRSHVVLPAFVNAHAHLDLSSLGPRPLSGGFLDWVGDVMHDRPTESAAIERAVHAGLAASHDAGVGWVADVAGSVDAVRARFSGPAVAGVSFLECFGIGRRARESAAQALAILEQLSSELPTGTRETTIALQPHAPYSAGPELYAAATGDGTTALASSHLAETEEELEFIADGTGPFADLLRRIDKWDDTIRGHGTTPIAHLVPQLSRGRWVIAHANYLSDDDVTLLRGLPDVTIAYCPIASEYFGHRGHRYRELLARGINVCLGTDSVLCQPRTEAQPFGILAQMRRLFRRDGADPATLLEMATTRGLAALGEPRRAACLRPGERARLVAVEFDPGRPESPLRQILENDAPVERVS